MSQTQIRLCDFTNSLITDDQLHINVLAKRERISPGLPYARNTFAHVLQIQLKSSLLLIGPAVNPPERNRSSYPIIVAAADSSYCTTERHKPLARKGMSLRLLRSRGGSADPYLPFYFPVSSSTFFVNSKGTTYNPSTFRAQVHLDELLTYPPLSTLCPILNLLITVLSFYFPSMQITSTLTGWVPSYSGHHFPRCHNPQASVGSLLRKLRRSQFSRLFFSVSVCIVRSFAVEASGGMIMS